MFRRTLITAAFAALVSAAPARADNARGAEAHWCMLTQFQITQVASLHETAAEGRGAVNRLIGAQLFVPAQPGLTPEWIRANLARHAKEPGTHPSCPIDLPGVTTAVTSGGTGFWIQISSADAKTAQEILERARRVLS